VKVVLLAAVPSAQDRVQMAITCLDAREHRVADARHVPQYVQLENMQVGVKICRMALVPCAQMYVHWGIMELDAEAARAGLAFLALPDVQWMSMSQIAVESIQANA
jgi:hypothetical protein